MASDDASPRGNLNACSIVANPRFASAGTVGSEWTLSHDRAAVAEHLQADRLEHGLGAQDCGALPWLCPAKAGRRSHLVR